MENLLELDRDGLTQVLATWGQPSFRARQIMTWVYQRHVTDFSEMTDLPLSLRERLLAEMRVGSLSLAHRGAAATARRSGCIDWMTGNSSRPC